MSYGTSKVFVDGILEDLTATANYMCAARIDIDNRVWLTINGMNFIYAWSDGSWQEIDETPTHTTGPICGVAPKSRGVTELVVGGAVNADQWMTFRIYSFKTRQ